MTPLEWLSLAGLCLTGAASPGPSLAVVLGACLAGGRTAGLAAAWAHAAGVGLYAALTVLGISAVIASRERVYLAIQVAGAIYLLWLAIGMWRHAAQSVAIEPTREQDIAAAARDGFAVAFLNPKLAVFMLALFSQFVRPDAGPMAGAQMIATAALIDGTWYTLVALLFTRRAWIDRLRSSADRLDRLFAALLAALALTILLRVLIGLP